MPRLSLAGLNSEQAEAVTHDGPITYVHAGPGAGKTTVLACRAAWWIVEHGVPVEEVVLLTYSQRAGQELRDRLREVLGREADGVFAGTLHSFALRLINQNREALGFRRPLQIYGGDLDRRGALARALWLLGEPTGDAQRLQAILEAIAAAKRNFESPEAVEARDPVLARIYREYQAVLRGVSAVDFDDMLYYAAQLLDGADAGRLALQPPRYILIDEVQDLDRTQWTMVRRLLGSSGRLFAVGDPLQTIYGWRGAAPALLEESLQDLGAARTALRVNYRSTATVVAAAAAVAARIGSGHVPQEPLGGPGAPVAVVAIPTREEEAGWVVEELHRLRRAGVIRRWADAAVLYRTRAQCDVLEAACVGARIPYLVRGERNLFHTGAARELLAYLRLAVNPDDAAALARAAESRALNLHELANVLKFGEPVTFQELARGPLPEPLTRERAGIGKLVGLVETLRAARARGAPAWELLEEAIQQSGLRLELAAAEDRRGVQAVDALRHLARTWGRGDLAAFLQDVDLMAQDVAVGDQEGLTLATVHSAKGLEWPVVFLVGLADGILPHQRALDGDGDPVEEARLFYVGITRARDLLYLTFPRYRERYGRYDRLAESRFLGLLPSELVTRREA